MAANSPSPIESLEPQRNPLSTIVALGLFIFVPSIAAILGLGNDGGSDEQRTNTEFPDVLGSPLDEDQWAQAGGWLEDRVPLRAEAIDLEWQIANRVDDRYANALADSDRVSAGAQDWLFFNESIEQPCVSSDTELEWRNEIDLANRIVESTGRRFVLALAPDRGTVVPHLLGDNDRSCMDANRQVIARLAQHTSVVDLGDVVTEENHAYRTDTHWSPAGALAGAEHVVETVQPGAWGNPDIISTTVSRRGDLDRMLGASVEEDVSVLTFAEQSTSTVERVPTSSENFPLRTSTTPGAHRLNVFLIHDSYGGYESDGIAAGSGAEYIRPWFSSFANLRIPDDGAIVGEEPAASAVRKADVVVHLFVQRLLPTRLGNGLLSLPLVSALYDELDAAPVAGEVGETVTSVPRFESTGALVIDGVSPRNSEEVAITTISGAIIGRLNMTGRIVLLVDEQTELFIEAEVGDLSFVALDFSTS